MASLKITKLLAAACLLAAFAVAPLQGVTALPPHLTEPEKHYTALLATLRTEVAMTLPVIDERKMATLESARETLGKARVAAADASQAMERIQPAKALVEHAKGKWIGGAENGIAQAEAAMRKATTDAEREAAAKELAKWRANRDDGAKALRERQGAYDKVKGDEPRLAEQNRQAQAALAAAQASEMAAARAVLNDVVPFLTSDKLDATLVKCAVLAGATPRRLAEFAQRNAEREQIVADLLGDTPLMKRMLEAGGAKGGNYGQAAAILAAIRKASPRSADGVLQRLALAVSLEHAVPIPQLNTKDDSGAPTTVDPVARYLHYEKAYLDGGLDPAFAGFSAWEYRMVVNCDAPDRILSWGREMLRTYRPDHVLTPDYAWRYSAVVRTDVTYGSAHVKDDLPSLHNYQNIPKNGGVCGRRAFFGRFILRSFGIPCWGVTQHAHAALSHWTPQGWVVNLGAGFNHSWWDKDDVPRSGADFLMETQSRRHARDYLTVLRAQWVSRALDEQAYNDRQRIAGGFWSRMAHYQMAALAAMPVEPVAAASNPAPPAATAKTAIRIEADPDRAITIPAAAYGEPVGRALVMPSISGGTQLHCAGGFKARYRFEARHAGRYELTARVATLQEGQMLLFSTNDSNPPVELPAPYTIGLWQWTRPVGIQLTEGPNILNFAVQDGSRGLSIKDFRLKRVE